MRSFDGIHDSRIVCAGAASQSSLLLRAPVGRNHRVEVAFHRVSGPRSSSQCCRLHRQRQNSAEVCPSSCRNYRPQNRLTSPTPAQRSRDLRLRRAVRRSNSRRFRRQGIRRTRRPGPRSSRESRRRPAPPPLTRISSGCVVEGTLARRVCDRFRASRPGLQQDGIRPIAIAVRVAPGDAAVAAGTDKRCTGQLYAGNCPRPVATD